MYIGYRRFPVASHLVRKKRKHFEQMAGHRTKLKHHNGKIMFATVKDLKVVFRKGPDSQPIASEDGHEAMWNKKYIFLEVTLLESLRDPPRNRRDAPH